MTKGVSYAQQSLESYCIGMKLRTLRTQKRLTLSRLAIETGLSTALLSKIETDRMIPTLPTLAIISRVYGVGLSYFFSEPSAHTLSITRKALMESDGRSSEPVSSIPLNRISNDTKLMIRIVEFHSGVTFWPLEFTRETSGMLYVLEGCLHIDAGGIVEKLDTGDCIYIESEMTLNLHADEKRHCRVLAVTPLGTHTTM
jgi:transcriptional regulator with XRE-family HTH domain